MPICIPIAHGVPFAPGPPRFTSPVGSGIDQYNNRIDDPRWRGAARVAFGDLSGVTTTGQVGELASLRLLHHTEVGATALYMMWTFEVFHPALDTSSSLLVGLGAADQELILQVTPFTEESADVVAAAPGSAVPGAPALTVYRKSGAVWTALVGGTEPAWILANLRTWLLRDPAARRRWAVALKLPLLTTPSGDSGLNAGAGQTLKLWYELRDVVPVPGPVPDRVVITQWPPSAGSYTLSTLNFPEPSTWETVTTGSDPACSAGVSLAPFDVGTRFPGDDHRIEPGNNTFFANPTVSPKPAIPFPAGGSPWPEGSLQASFRLANWGTTAATRNTRSDLWRLIETGPARSREITEADVTASGSGPLRAAIEAVGPIPIAPGDIGPDGSGKPYWQHQCMLVELAGLLDKVKPFTATLPDLFNSNAHGFANGDLLRLFTDGALPTGLEPRTPYHVRDATANSFKLAATPAGAALTFTSTGSGSHAAVKRGPTFLNDSVYRNMDFAEASLYERPAQVSVVTLPPDPLGRPNRDVYLCVQRFNMPSVSEPIEIGSIQKLGNALWEHRADRQVARRLRALAELVPSRDEEGGELVPEDDRLALMEQYMPLLKVFAFHDTSELVQIGTRQVRVWEPQVSFHHAMKHEGDLYGWDYQIAGADMIAPDLWKVRVPNNGTTVVTTRILAKESPTDSLDHDEDSRSDCQRSTEIIMDELYVIRQELARCCGKKAVRVEAESFLATGGDNRERRSGCGVERDGGAIGKINDGDWALYGTVDFGQGGWKAFAASVVCPHEGTRLEIYLDDPAAIGEYLAASGKRRPERLTKAEKVVKLEVARTGSHLRPPFVEQATLLASVPQGRKLVIARFRKGDGDESCALALYDWFEFRS